MQAWLKRNAPWVAYWGAQVVTWGAFLAGLVVLLVPCLAHAWETSPAPSVKPGHPWIDQWSWPWLRPVYHNPEDGDSGQRALVWNSTGTAQGPYWPMSVPAWAAKLPRVGFVVGWLQDSLRAYVWSAWRNNADGLKFLFRWRGALPAPWKTASWPLIGPVAYGWKLEDSSYWVPVFGRAP